MSAAPSVGDVRAADTDGWENGGGGKRPKFLEGVAAVKAEFVLQRPPAPTSAKSG